MKRREFLAVLPLSALFLSKDAYAASVDYIADTPNSTKIMLRRAGVAPSDLIDDTVEVTVDGFTQHCSGFKVFDLTQYGVPASAQSVMLGTRGIITKALNNYGTSLWLHAKPFGSRACLGSSGYENFPLDGTYGTQPTQEGMIMQSVAQMPGQNTRDTASMPVKCVNGKIELSWGYRKGEGDAVAIVVYLNGWQ